MEQDELSLEKIGAIMRSIVLGRTLQQQHPEVAELYRKGYTYPQIVSELGIQEEYSIIGENVAPKAVERAISGHTDGFGIDAYDGLIGEDERKKIALNHRQQGGHSTRERGVGVHAQTLEQLSEAGRIGGPIGGAISGRTTYERGIGVHALSTEEKREIGCKNYRDGKGIHAFSREQKIEVGKASAVARGLTPLTEEEKRFAYELSQTSYFKRGSLSNNLYIAQALNGYFHNSEEIRSTKAVQMILTKYKKSLKSKSLE